MSCLLPRLYQVVVQVLHPAMVRAILEKVLEVDHRCESPGKPTRENTCVLSMYDV
jgi:hypothetical protein